MKNPITYFQALRERIAFWLAPRLPKLLRQSYNVAERLDMRMTEEAETKTREAEYKREILDEMDAAIALAGGAPWLSPENGKVRESRSSAAAGLIRAREGIVNLKETIYGMAELEIALEDRGWKRLIAQSQYEFSRFGINSIILICRLYWVKNPLARRGVDVSSFYVFGRGMEISSPDEAANEQLTAFFDNPMNATVFSHSALVKKEKQSYTDGNVFFAFFSDPASGDVQCRCLDPIEISDIICDPNDSSTPWFYRRDWTMEQFDPATGKRTSQQMIQWYFALGYEDIPNFPADVRQIEGYPVALDANGAPIPVLHHKDGELPGSKFGIPRMYPAIDWMRAYRQGLEDLCTTWRALARFAWMVETKGGAPAIAAFKQTLATTLANDLSQIETNPPPVTGSSFVSGPNNKLTPVQAGGNTTMNPDNLRRVLLMVCAGFGIGEHLFGDATTGSLATAASLERPAELMFQERQEVWREVIQRIGHYILTRSLRAPKGKLREAFATRHGVAASDFDPSEVRITQASRQKAGVAGITFVEKSKTPVQDSQEISIDVKFPDILTHDIGAMIKAIMSACTLDGNSPVGIDQKVAFTLMLSELGVEDPTAVIEAMFPESSYSADRTKGPPPPNRIMDRGVAAPEDPTDGSEGTPAPAEPPAAPVPPAAAAKKKAKESAISQDPEVIRRACEQLIEAARRNLQVRKAAEFEN